MAVLPFRLQGSSRAARLRVIVQAALHAWLQGWCTAQPPIATTVELAGQETAMGEWWECDGGRAWLCLPTTALPGLGRMLADVANVDAHDFAAAIGRRALSDLMAGIVSQATVELGRIDAPDAAHMTTRHGALGFRIALGELRMLIQLSQPLCDLLAPPSAPRPIAMDSRRDALMASPLRLHATIDLGGADIHAATTLRPGEIIKTSAIPDSLVSVRADDGTVLFRGVLESINGHKALRCTSVELSQRNK